MDSGNQLLRRVEAARAGDGRSLLCSLFCFWFRVRLRLQDANEGKTSVLVGEVHTVPHNKVVGAGITHVLHVHVGGASAVLVKQCGDRDREALLGTQMLSDPREGLASVDEVFHDQDMAPRRIDAQVLLQFYRTGRLGAFPVAGHHHEVKLIRDSDLPENVRREHEGAIQEAHHQDGAFPLVVLRYLGRHLTDFGTDHRFREQDALDVRRPLFWNQSAVQPVGLGFLSHKSVELVARHLDETPHTVHELLIDQVLSVCRRRLRA
mmetsp:Transcript_23972/g.26628  ORF Transcript_23972/g.26628 Transcript_23972/m.26628 type:complete len:264 (+) Transcript_23972:54-845(+)